VADAAERGGALRLDPVLLWTLLGALAVRLLALWLVSPTPLAGDELDYFWRGAERMQGLEPERLGFRPPVMEFFFGGLFWFTGASIPAARLATVVLSVALLVPLYDIGRRLGGVGVARFGAGIAALYPNFIAFSHYLWSETIYLFLVLWGLSLIGRHVERPANWKLAAAGVAFGLSALTRVVGLAFPLITAGWLLWVARDRLRKDPIRSLVAPAVLLLATLIPIAPWSAHLNRAGEPFSPITRTTWHYLYIGNAPHDGPRHPVSHYESLGNTLAEREQAAQPLVFRAISERLPAWPFEKLASELPDFFTPTSFAVRRLTMPDDVTWAVNLPWAYKFRFEWLDGPVLRQAAVVLIVAAYLAVVLLGAAGLALMPHSSWRGLLLLFVLSQVGPTLLTFAVSRFRIAPMAVAILGAAWLIRAGPEAWRNATPLGQGSAIFATGAIAAMIWLRWHHLFEKTWA
jgi:4-amino-4-deoxy-L-arabinose transferase-like glycosyltransferase